MHACLNLSAYGNGGSFFSLQHVWVNGYLVPPTLLIVCKHVMSYYHGNTLGQGSLIKAATWCLFCTSEWFCVILTSLVPRSPPFFVLWFALGIIHESGRAAKNGEGLGILITWIDVRWTRGGCRGEGPNCKKNTLDRLFERSTLSALPQFWTLDVLWVILYNT